MWFFVVLGGTRVVLHLSVEVLGPVWEDYIFPPMRWLTWPIRTSPPPGLLPQKVQCEWIDHGAEPAVILWWIRCPAELQVTLLPTFCLLALHSELLTAEPVTEPLPPSERSSLSIVGGPC